MYCSFFFKRLYLSDIRAEVFIGIMILSQICIQITLSRREGGVKCNKTVHEFILIKAELWLPGRHIILFCHFYICLKFSLKKDKN